MPQYIGCPNAEECGRTGYIPGNNHKIQECKFCGPIVRRNLHINGFLPYGWTTREMAVNICQHDAKIKAAQKAECELAIRKSQNPGMSNSQAKKFLRENTLKYEKEIFNDLKLQYKLD
jgi:hypothetical protein